LCGNYKKIEASYKLIFYTLFGSLFLLFSTLFLFTSFSTFNIDLLPFYVPRYVSKAHGFNFYTLLFMWFSFLTPFLIKIPTFPFHLGLPFAHVQAPTTIYIILASIIF
jgi:NADH-quinone oxidoreductase subunit M